MLNGPAALVISIAHTNRRILFSFRGLLKRKRLPIDKETAVVTPDPKKNNEKNFIFERKLVKILPNPLAPAPVLKVVGPSSMTIMRTVAPPTLPIESVEIKVEAEDDFEEVLIDGTGTSVAGSTDGDGSAKNMKMSSAISEEMLVFVCKECKMYFPTRQMLAVHNADMHRTSSKEEKKKGYKLNKNQIFTCDFCTFKTPVRSTISSHVQRKHPDKHVRVKPVIDLEAPLKPAVKKFKGYTMDESRQYRCDFCLFNSPNMSTMVSHTKRKHRNKLLGDDDVILIEPKEEPVSDVNDESSWPVEMIENEEELLSTSSLPKKSGLAKGKFNCPYCPFQGATDSSSLYLHMKRRHREKWLKTVAQKVAEKSTTADPDTSEILCSQCPFKTNKRAELNVHMLQNHSSVTKADSTSAPSAAVEEVEEEEEEEEDLIDDMFEEVNEDDFEEYREEKSEEESFEVTHEPSKRAYIKCPQCPFRAFAASTLRMHLKRRHQKDPLGSDELSTKRAPNTNRSKREKSVLLMTGYACHYCTFAAAKISSLTAHTSRVHAGLHQPILEIPVREFDCDQCDIKTTGRKKMQTHLKRWHLPQANADGMFVCTVCSYETTSRMGLQRHISIKHSKSRNEPVLEEFQCLDCEFTTPNAKMMEWHRQKHTPDPELEGDGNIYSCNDCEFATWTKTQLFTHIRRKHKDNDDEDAGVVIENLYVCEQCDYTTKNKHSMKVHVIRKHTTGFNHECEICGKQYKVKADLTNHIRFQHREQPIICDVCGKTCRNSNLLYLHQKFAHYKPDFECHICHRRMVSQANLDEHILKQHEMRQDAVCDECGKTFTKAARLKIHKRTHTGVKPYSCKICTRAFARRNGLRQHLLIHTGQRPYLCDICGKSFTQKTGLISHRKSHPGDHPPLPRVTIDHVLNDLLNEEESEA